MPPKKGASSKGNAASGSESHEYNVGDTVLCRVKGYPDWPGKLVEHDTAPAAVRKSKGNKSLLVRFFGDTGDFAWAILKDLKPLAMKSIEAFLSDTGKKSGKLRQSYEIAKDPSEWEESIKNGAIGGMGDEEEDEDEDEDIDMLAEDGEVRSSKAGQKRKRASDVAVPKEKKEKKEPASKKEKKEPVSKKRKTDDEKKPKADKPTASKPAKADKKATSATNEEDNSDGAKTVRGWRATLQKAFLTKGVPAADKMPEFDTIFSAMETFEMQSEWLATYKLGKVLKKMSVLPEIAREAEYKIKERSSGLIEKWKEMMVKEGEEPAAVDGSGPAATTNATTSGDQGDLTMVATENENEKVDIAAEKKEINGDVEMQAAVPNTEQEKKNEEEAEFVPEKNGDMEEVTTTA